MIIDISKHNGDIDFAKLKGKVKLVIARAQCRTTKDVKIDEYVKGMRENDIPFGVYNFTYAVTEEEAERDARMFWDVAHGYNPLFYVLDAEEEGITQDIIKAWVRTIRKCGAKKVGAYIGHNRYDDYGFDDLRHLFDFVWIPRYGKNDGTLEGSKQPKYTCDLWQYTSEGCVDGLEHRVDLNTITGQGHSLGWFQEGGDTIEKVFTASEWAVWLKQQAALKRPYWYGTYYLQCTEDLLKRKSEQYPAHYKESRMPRYRQDIEDGQMCGDCVNGAIKGAVWSELGTRKSIYKSHGCPDKSANGMFEYCQDIGMDWGNIGTMPNQIGQAVHMSGHVGIYVGNGEVVEWRGFNYGCVVTRLAERPWKYWYAVPWVDYDVPAKDKSDIDIGALGGRLLKRNRKGADVAVLQELLDMLGYDIGEYGVDSYYGKDTERAVREFQKEHDLEVDGDYGPLSHREMMNVLEELERGDSDIQHVSKKKVRITGGRVNARSGAGTNNSIITVVRKGDVFEYVATAENGWHGIRLDEGVAWVSNKYGVAEE